MRWRICRVVLACVLMSCWGAAAGATPLRGWVLGRLPHPPISSVSSISCASASMCVAVGADSFGPQRQDGHGLLWSWDGSRWSLQTITDRARHPRFSLGAVSCPSSQFCMALGSNSTGVPVTLRWDGRSWTRRRLRAAADGLGLLSCTSGWFCMAVGSQNSTVGPPVDITDRWNGSRWTISQPDSEGIGYSTPQLGSISCSSRNWCAAMGQTTGCEPSVRGGRPVFPDQTYNCAALYTDVWSGTQWSTLSGIGPSDPFFDSLEDVGSLACPSGGTCVAVNDGGAALWSGTTFPCLPAGREAEAHHHVAMATLPPPLGVYLHVPFCAARCGYCDFNTYVPGGRRQPSEFLSAALLELRQARAELGDRPASTVFVGGGTPTLLGAEGLLRLLAGVGDTLGLAADAEVTTEANPESVDAAMLRELHRGGFTRVSLGMQSAAPHVLRTLDRVHTPGRAVAAAVEAREAGFAHVSLDLIYGTPGESDADWERSLDAVLSAAPDHVSAYALTVESGTALGAAVARGSLPAPDEDDQARRYRRADDRLRAAGLHWYELSSWARGQEARCRHNVGYWRSYDWWGIGPGAHSHVAGVRWCNVRSPVQYAGRLARGRSPAAAREVLTADQRALEQVMLGLRTSDGLALDALGEAGARAARREAARGRVEIADGQVRLTRRGRLFADAVIRSLTGLLGQAW